MSKTTLFVSQAKNRIVIAKWQFRSSLFDILNKRDCFEEEQEFSFDHSICCACSIMSIDNINFTTAAFVLGVVHDTIYDIP